MTAAPTQRGQSFSEGLAMVARGELHGDIDKRDRTVIKPQFSFARPFSLGLAFVGVGRDTGYITPEGLRVWRSVAP